MYLLVLIIGHSGVRERWNIGILIWTFQCVFDYATKGQDVSKWLFPIQHGEQQAVNTPCNLEHYNRVGEN